jgi:hypothetical protein
MRPFRHYLFSMIIPAILVFAFACGKSSLTPQELKEIKHFKTAQKSFLESSRYLRELTKDTVLVGSMGESERNTYIKMLMETLTEAKSVSDSTLAKIHPELPSTFRSIFMPCIDNKLRGFRDFDPGASVQGTELHNAWIDWWNAHYKEFTKI